MTLFVAYVKTKYNEGNGVWYCVFTKSRGKSDGHLTTSLTQWRLSVAAAEVAEEVQGVGVFGFACGGKLRHLVILSAAVAEAASWFPH